MSMIDFMLSERQQKVLAALLLSPEGEFTTNELMRLSGPGKGATQRILDGLVTSGIATRRPRMNQVVYQINSANPIYPELRSICFKTFGVADVVRRHLAKLSYGIDRAFVFGSMVRGEARADSDLDLMVIGDVDPFRLSAVVEELESEIGRSVDLNHHSPEEWESLSGDRVIRAILDGPVIEVL